MVACPPCTSLIHFQPIFVSGVREQVHVCEYLIIPAPFIEEIICSLLSILGSFVKY